MSTVVDPGVVSSDTSLELRCEVRHNCPNGCCDDGCLRLAAWRGLARTRTVTGVKRERFYACTHCHDELVSEGAKRKTGRVIEWERL